MIVQEEIKINHYLVKVDTDSSYKEDYFYSPIKGEDAKRHREDGPALVYKSKTEDMTYFEWWNQGKMVAIFNSKSNKFKKTENGSFMSLKAVQLPEKWKGNEGTLSLSDIEGCNQLVIKNMTATECSLNNKDISVNNISNIREKLSSNTSNGLRLD
jgi:hypothetical protein